MIENKDWLAAYLYYAQPWDKFLVDAVAPFVKLVMDKGLAEQYFFIRYWERGPHIRLRFKGDRDKMNKEIKPLLDAHFNKYFENNPSERNEGQYVNELPEDKKWFPNNSIQYIEYEPETERYGGDEGILISERQFQASTDSTFAAIRESEEWDYERALGVAIQLHLSFAYATGMDLKEAKGFFHGVYQSWLPRAYYFFEKDITQEELQKRRETTLIAFEENFNQQKEMLVPFVSQLWEALEEQIEFEEEWVNSWINDMKKIKSDIENCQKKGKLIPPSYFKLGQDDEATIEQQERWSIYSSYIHMINNRLGVLNQDEGYLDYLVKECVKIISKE